MKKTIAGIGIIACAALCAAVWPRSVEVEDLPAEPVKTAVSAEIEVRAEKVPHIFISADMPTPVAEAVTESKSTKIEVTAEEKTEPAPKPISKSAPVSTEPKSGDRTVIDGKPHVWIPGFGWIVDEGGGSVGTMVGNPGDQLTGNKVGIMGSGTVAEDMYESGHKIGIMGDDESASSSTSPPTYAEPEITGDVIYVPLQPPVTKDSTPPASKPNGEPYNP